MTGSKWFGWDGPGWYGIAEYIETQNMVKIPWHHREDYADGTSVYEYARQMGIKKKPFYLTEKPFGSSD